MPDRLEDLESRMAWYEKQRAELDGVVRELFDEVARLRADVAALKEERGDAPEGIERPPHY